MATVTGFDLNAATTGLNGTTTYIEGASATLLAPHATVTATGDFSGQTLVISGLLAEDQIGFGSGVTISGQNIKIGNKIIGTFSGGGGGSNFVVSFTNNATATQVQTLLQNLTFMDSSDAPIASHTLSISLAGTSRTDLVTITPVNDVPVLDLNGATAGNNATASFLEQTPIAIAPAAMLSDPDSANLMSLTTTLTARPDGSAETLSLNAAAAAAASGAGLTVSYNASTGQLSILGSASQATYQTILRGITYNNTSDNPSTAGRTLQVVANDGAANSAVQSISVSITPVNDAPAVDLNGAATGTGTTVSYNIGNALTKIAPAGTVIDLDSADFNTGSLRVALPTTGPRPIN
jgi:hypothetical protein